MPSALSLTNLWNDITKKSNFIISEDYSRIFTHGRKADFIESVHAINTYYEDVKLWIADFPYILSLYWYVSEDYALMSSDKSMQILDKKDILKSSQKVLNEVFSYTSYTPKYVAGLNSNDFPWLPREEEPDFIELVSITRRTGNNTFIINLDAEYLRGLYEAAAGESGTIRLIDSNGAIISSSINNEAGTKFTYADKALSSANGESVYDDNKTQLIWMQIPDLGLTITKEAPLSDYYRGFRKIINTTLYVLIPGYLLTCVFIYLWLSYSFKPLYLLRKSMLRTGEGYYDEPIQVKGNDELTAIIHSYNIMIKDLKKLHERNKAIENEKHLHELAVLRNQINPHFLYNTLSAIKWMCMIEGNKRVSDSIGILGRLIMPVFKSTTPTWSLREELLNAEDYLRLINIRYNDTINVTIQAETTLLDIQVLKFIIQPLVENAVRHGFDGEPKNAEIHIKVFVENNDIYICVTDNGKGMSSEKIEQINHSLRDIKDGGIGIFNTNRRIFLQYGTAYGIYLSSSVYGGLDVVIHMPKCVNQTNKN